MQNAVAAARAIISTQTSRLIASSVFPKLLLYRYSSDAGQDLPAASAQTFRTSGAGAGGVGNDRQAEGLGDRQKHVPVCTAVGRVVADHDGVEEPALGQLGGERPLVTGNPDPAGRPSRLASRR